MTLLTSFPSPAFYIIFAVIVFAAIATAALFKHYYFDNLNHHRELATLKADVDNRVLRAQVETQEQTFQNISRDIHDDIGQKLSLVKLWVDNSKADDIADAPAVISDVIAHLRDLSKNLSADLVKKDGLFEAISADVKRINRQEGLTAVLERSEHFYFLTEDTEIILYRIYQEAVQNIIKHAGASKLLIHLNYHDDKFRMEISDNGSGFTKKDTTGQGLQNIQRRTKNIGGTSTIESDNRGTYLSVNLPIIKNGQNKNIPG